LIIIQNSDLKEKEYIQYNIGQACDSDPSLDDVNNIDIGGITIMSTRYPVTIETRNYTKNKPFPPTMQYSIFFKSYSIPYQAKFGSTKQYNYTNPNNIPDIDKTKDNLNSPTGLTNQTVYGNPMSNDCNALLTGMLTNSYVMTDIQEYSKLSDILDSSIIRENGGVLKNYEGQKLVTDKDGNMLYVKSNLYTNDKNYVGNGTNEYKTIMSNGVANVITSDSCEAFYPKYCDYYYYNDFVDGLTYKVIKYGEYTEDQYIDTLRKSSLNISEFSSYVFFVLVFKQL
jgi:hypothetical protein